jgi:hypothetical protein
MLVKILKNYIKFIRWVMKFSQKFKPFKYLFYTLTAIFTIIKVNWGILSKYAIIRYLRAFIIVLSYFNLAVDVILLIAYFQFDIFNWIFTIPAFITLFDYLPTGIQDFFFNFKNRILYFWNIILNFYRKLLKAILGTIDKEYPIPEGPDGEIEIPKIPENSDPSPDKGYENYKKWIGDHQYHLLASALVLIFGVYIYLYWDDITRTFKRGGDDSQATPISEELSSLISSEPSSGRNVDDYQPGYLRHFSRKLGDLSRAVKDRAISLFKQSKYRNPPVIPSNIPAGLYTDENGNMMWDGLPIPRVESLGDSTEHYITLDNSGHINIISNKFGEDMADIISPSTGFSIARQHINSIDKAQLINEAKNHAYYLSPENSYIRNPISRIENIILTIPSIENISADTSDLPSTLYSKASYHTDYQIPSTSKVKYPEFEMTDINLEENAFKKEKYKFIFKRKIFNLF